MLAAIDLNDEAGFRTIEVECVGWVGMLAPELQTLQAAVT